MRRNSNDPVTPLINNTTLEISNNLQTTSSVGSHSLSSQLSQNEGRILGSGNNLREHLRNCAIRKLERGENSIPIIEEYEGVPANDAIVIEHINSDPALEGLRTKILHRIADDNFSSETINTIIRYIPSELRNVIINSLPQSTSINTYLPILNIALLGGVGLDNTQELTQNILNAINNALVELPVDVNDLVDENGAKAKNAIDETERENRELNNTSNANNRSNAENILNRLAWGTIWRRAVYLGGSALGIYMGQPYIGPIIGQIGRTMGGRIEGSDGNTRLESSNSGITAEDVFGSFMNAGRTFLRWLAGG